MGRNFSEGIPEDAEYCLQTCKRRKYAGKTADTTTCKGNGKTYVVKKGDNLWNICKKELGDGSKFGELAKKNGISNPSLIYPGQVIKL